MLNKNKSDKMSLLLNIGFTHKLSKKIANW